ncbi:DUF6035 family protein [Rhodanobacter denitrificans]|uniref:DUF6035 family protein n=1 Tax=Rhodanobacter denitrificans TaxID=666685 RepID=UPI001F3BB9B2|nr:DUF6035 family protein [Rhodanobacter denitrificans]UJJ57596.1 DUF6035 family protein [Rhodanobacter denitrificans]
MTGFTAFAAKEQSYPHVLDRETGAWVSLESFLGRGDYGDVIADKRVALKMALHDGRLRYVCPWCGNAMFLASLRLQDKTIERFYFKHQFENTACSGIVGKGDEAICAQQFMGAKEGEEHKRFKARVLESLNADRDFSDTALEKRHVSADRKRWRQPDVQSTWKGQQVVFEAQMSTTFLHVITQRMSFYAHEGVRLLWLFRDLNPNHFRLTEDDIFYSNNRNGFRVTDETVGLSRATGRFALECVWLVPTVVGERIEDQWQTQTVFFDELRHDTSQHGVPRSFYFDYDKAKAEAESAVRRQKQERRDRPLRDAMESFCLDLWAHRLPTPEAVHERWDPLVVEFARRGFALPDAPLAEEGPNNYLQAAYSAKHGRSVWSRHEDLVKLGFHIFDVRKKTLWIYRLMLEAYGRHEHMKTHDPNRKWAGKAVEYKGFMRNNNAAYLPSRAFDPLLCFLFPEVADTLVKHPRDVLPPERTRV